MSDSLSVSATAIGSRATSITYVDAHDEVSGRPEQPSRAQQTKLIQPEDSGRTDNLDDRSTNAAEIPQHQRVMGDILSQASYNNSIIPVKPIDTSSVGSLIRRLRVQQLDEGCAENSTLLECEDFLRSSYRRRVVKELQYLQRLRSEDGLAPYVNLHTIGSSLRTFFASIEGPPSSPYEGGIFHIAIVMPRDYPISPPHCRFVTKIYHPNIDPRGRICLDVIQHSWSPCLTLEKILISISSMLDDPCLTDPLVPEIAQLYVRDRSAYEENTRMYTRRYGMDLEPSMDRIMPVYEELLDEAASRLADSPVWGRD